MEILRTGGAEEAGELLINRDRLVGALGLAWCRRTGDAAAPGIGRLGCRSGIRIDQGISGRDIHEDERVENNLQTSGLEIGNGAETDASDGVPPKAAVPEAARLVRRAFARLRPATDQRAGFVAFAKSSTRRGSIRHSPQRKSLPNQETVSDTNRKLVQTS